MATPVSFYSPEGVKKSQELQRQLMMAQLLMGQKAPQREPTRFVPRESLATSLLPALVNAGGMYMATKAQKGQQDLQAAEYAKILERMGGGGSQPPIMSDDPRAGGITGTMTPSDPFDPAAYQQAPQGDPGVDGARTPAPQGRSQLNPYGIDPLVAAQAYMADPAKYASALMDEKKPTELGRNIAAAGFTGDQRSQAYANALLPKAPTPTDDEREYAAAKQQGYPGTLQQWIMDQKRAGATNVSVNTEKSLYGTLADAQAKQYSDLYSQAQGAPDAISRARRVRELLDKTPYTGAAADWKLAVGKGAKALGFDYAGDDIQNTELLARELGQNALDSVKSSGLAGSQGLTEGERKFLMQVVGGTIELDNKTLRRVADLNERVARSGVKKWNDTAGRLDPNQLRTLGMSRVDIPEADSPAMKPGLPKAGAVVDGWEFLGGDPANPQNWRKR